MIRVNSTRTKYQILDLYERIIKDQIVCGMEKNFFHRFYLRKEKLQFTKHLISLINEWTKNLDNNFAVGAGLTDLTKSFDQIPHVFFINKLSAYSFSDKGLSYIYSYLTNLK